MNARDFRTSDLKVLHLIDTGGPGGAETIFAWLASRMGDPGSSVTVVPYDGWLAQRLRGLGLTPRLMGGKGSFDLPFLIKLACLIRRSKVQLVYTHLLGSSVYGALAGALTGTPVVSVFHGPSDLQSPGRFAGVKRWIVRNLVASVVAVSRSTREALFAFGVAPGLIRLISNGVDLTAYKPGSQEDLKAELGLGPQALLVGAIGNIRAPKAYDVLLRAASLVLRDVPEAFFVIVGEGDEGQLAPLLSLRKELGLDDHVRFLGFRKSTAQLFQNFDVFVSSSSSEGLSLSFLEAMATGRAIVATRSGGAEEAVVSGESGLLVPTSQPDKLAQALIEALQDADLRQRLGERARQQVERFFSADVALEHYCEAGRQALCS